MPVAKCEAALVLFGDIAEKGFCGVGAVGAHSSFLAGPHVLQDEGYPPNDQPIGENALLGDGVGRPSMGNTERAGVAARYYMMLCLAGIYVRAQRPPSGVGCVCNSLAARLRLRS